MEPEDITGNTDETTTAQSAAETNESASSEADAQQEEAQGQESAADWEKRIQGLEVAVAEERKKRQAAEHQTEWLRQQAMAAQQPQQPKQQPQIDWVAEDDAFWKAPAQYIRRSAQLTAQQIASQQAAEIERQRLEASERRVAAQYEDYGEKLMEFRQILEREPWLYQEITHEQEPAKAMYDLVSRRQKYGATPDEMKRRIEAEVRAQIEEERRGKTARNAAAEATPTQADARGIGAAPTQASYAGGHLLDDVFADY